MEFVQAIDNNIVLWVKEFITCDFLNLTMPFVSSVGNVGIIWIIIGLSIIIFSKKHRRWGIVLLLALGVTALIGNGIIKPIVGRMRPFDNLMLDIIIDKPHDFSFPSGHTSAAFAAAVVIFAINKKWGIVMTVFAFLMGFSRLYLLVHYPSDIIVGMLLGVVVASIIIKVSRKLGFV